MLATLTLSKTKIRKEKECAQLKWEVISADRIVLFANGKELQECDKQGFLDVNPGSDTEYCLKIYDGNLDKPEERKATLLVRPEAIVEFFADKDYTLPGVPLKLSWNVKYASSIVFDGKEKKPNDSVKIIEGIEQETEFTISVTDEFETKEHHVKVRMLPIPFVQTLLVPTPEIEDSVNVIAQMPIQFKDTQLISLETPTINHVDIVKVAQQLPQITTIPIMETPQIEISKSIIEKIEDKLNGYLSQVQNVLSDTLQKFKILINSQNK